MSPIFIFFNNPYSMLGNTEHMAYSSLSNPKFKKIPYFWNIFFFKFCSLIPRTTIGISRIIRRSYIFKIAEFIVGGIFVLMMNLFSFWTFTNKSFSNKPMSQYWKLFFIYCNRIINSSIMKSFGHYMASFCSPAISKAFKSAATTNFVEFLKTQNWFPNLSIFHKRSITYV